MRHTATIDTIHSDMSSLHISIFIFVRCFSSLLFSSVTFVCFSVTVLLNNEARLEGCEREESAEG